MELDGDQKLLLYAVGALDEPLRSSVKLQKLFFLISNVFEDIDDLFKFEPHLFGPYSESLDNLSSELINLGLITKRGSSFILTPKGENEFHKIKPKKPLKEVINDFKSFLNDIPDEKLMIFIYACYPNYISESVKWDKLKKNRVKAALYLLKHEKVSFSKAAQIAGKNFGEFQYIAKENKIRWRG